MTVIEQYLKVCLVQGPCLMFCVIERNVQYYCERFGGRLHNVINSAKKRTVLADDIVTRAGMIQEKSKDVDLYSA